MKDLSKFKGSEYVIMGAIRGCDLGYNHVDEIINKESAEFVVELKHILVGRIRAIVFEENDIQEAFYKNIPITEKEIDEFKQKINKPVIKGRWFNHFIIHLKDAVEVTKEHEIWGEYGDEIVRLLSLAI